MSSCVLGRENLEGRPAQQLVLAGRAHQRTKGRIAEHDPVLAVDIDRVGQQLDEAAIALFAVAEGLLGLLARGDFAGDADQRRMISPGALRNGALVD